MYDVCKFIENIIKFIKIKLKVFYWKVKYGKRIKIGKKFRFRKGMIINIAKDGYLEIGDNCSFNNYCSINCRNRIIIGNNNMFGENVKMYDHNHVFNDKTVNMQTTYKCAEIKIGNNNWIGTGTILLKNSELLNNCVLGAGTILNERISSDSILSKNNKDYIIDTINYK